MHQASQWSICIQMGLCPDVPILSWKYRKLKMHLIPLTYKTPSFSQAYLKHAQNTTSNKCWPHRTLLSAGCWPCDLLAYWELWPLPPSSITRENHTTYHWSRSKLKIQIVVSTERVLLLHRYKVKKLLSGTIISQGLPMLMYTNSLYFSRRKAHSKFIHLHKVISKPLCSKSYAKYWIIMLYGFSFGKVSYLSSGSQSFLWFQKCSNSLTFTPWPWLNFEHDTLT